MIILLASALLLVQEARTLPTTHAPLRNTFVVAAETVIDDANKIDLKATDPTSDALIQQLREAKDRLAGMAQDDREKDIANTANDMVFAATACHLQATNGADTTTCQTQFARARSRVMEAINKHKAGGTWVDGPPA
jgi:hypothetical protein